MQPRRTASLLAAAFVFTACAIVNQVKADDQFDPTVDYRSLKEEFAAEDAGATYGDKRKYIRMPDGTLRQRTPSKKKNFSRFVKERK